MDMKANFKPIRKAEFGGRRRISRAHLLSFGKYFNHLLDQELDLRLIGCISLTCEINGCFQPSSVTGCIRPDI